MGAVPRKENETDLGEPKLIFRFFNSASRTFHIMSSLNFGPRLSVIGEREFGSRIT